VESTRQPIFNIPFVIVALVLVLVLVHGVFVLVLSEEQTDELLLLFAFLPARYDATVAMLPGGWGAWIWTFVTYAFIHGNLTHLIFNLLWLIAFGTPVARRFGTARFLVFFAATAAAGAAAHLATHFGETQPTIVIGASAAVSGAMAAAMRFAFQRGGPLGLLRSGDESAYRVPAVPLGAMLRDPRLLAFLGVWFGVNLLFGLGTFKLPGVEESIAWEGHIGGFLAGLFGFALFDPVRNSPALADPQEPNQEPGDASMDH
jgi:membrane associated rhomboid family serine protease